MLVPIFTSQAPPKLRTVPEISSSTFQLNRLFQRAIAGLGPSTLVSRIFGFGVCLALICTPAAFSQDQEVTETASSTPIAYVYVQVKKGVNAYSESAAGKLTLVKGSPFAVAGQMEGITGNHLLTVGTTVLHSYQIASNGAVGKQIASINTAEYDSEDCGPTTGNKAILDHSGKYFYVQLGSDDDNDTCDNSDLQTYQIASNGDFTFVGNFYTESDGAVAPLVLDSSDKHGYSFLYDLSDFSYFTSFIHMNDLASNPTFTEKDPATDPNLSYYLQPIEAAADPNEHLAVLMVQCAIGDDACEGSFQLASYTINPTTGGISSTNTEDNAPWVNPGVLDMSYDGKFVAIGGSGVQVLNFNGAALPTNLATVVPGVQFDQVTWDKADHLFALSYEAQELYIFNVSKAKGVVKIGLPMIVPGAYGLTGIIVATK